MKGGKKEVITMTNITINNQKHTIELTKKDYNKACKFGTQEYLDLQEARKSYPNYKVERVVRKSAKPAFKGLTYHYMERYIMTHNDEGQKNMKEYMELRALTEEAEANFGESAHYQTVKDWFLDKYPEIDAYHQKRDTLLTNSGTRMENKRAEKAHEQRKARRDALLGEKTN